MGEVDSLSLGFQSHLGSIGRARLKGQKPNQQSRGVRVDLGGFLVHLVMWLMLAAHMGPWDERAVLSLPP